ncbi:Glutathione reductase, chloroplastic (Fragment) [Seminavis robusta]|uniref:Glutathione reductase n=1 Tax=Seminavis robusta TaxID=568900 RepID=A0A9N8EAI2_9STRA
MTTYDYDYLLLGGGSGGVSSAKRAAINYGKKVCVVEANRWGGTCVNVGCVPKKIMFLAASMRETLVHECPQYGFGTPDATFDWAAMKKKRDAYIVRLNKIYESGLDKNDNVDIFEGWGSFVDAHTIEIKLKDGTTKTVTADKIVVATGGKPMVPPGEGVAEHCITSDGFFELESLPSKVVVVGAGYIAVELAGVLHALGSETHLVVRKQKALREFDPDIADMLDAEYTKAGITIHRNTNGVAKIELGDGGKKKVTMQNDEVIEGADIVLMAPGRVPITEGLGLEKAGVKLKEGKGYLEVDEFQNTSVDNIYALGDVCGKVELTPMAIAAGRRLSDRLFGGDAYEKARASYENVPTVVFSHPPIGGCGMTEPQAVAKYGEDNIKVYKSRFANLFYGIYDVADPNDKPKTFMKVICAGENELVVGMHVIGMGADEMMQGFGVAMKMGCTKADLDSCVAIHPTASEELVTMGTWGTSPQASGAAVPPLMGASAPEPKLKSKM